MIVKEIKHFIVLADDPQKVKEKFPHNFSVKVLPVEQPVPIGYDKATKKHFWHVVAEMPPGELFW